MAIDGISSNQMRFWGLASGLDVDEIVRGFMLAERAPLDRLLQRKQILEWQQDEYRTINLKLRELDDLAFQLRLESTFDARRIAVSDEQAVRARVSSGAAVGTHTIKVQQLADGMRLYSEVAIENGQTLADLGFVGQISFDITRHGMSPEDDVTETITLEADDTIDDLVRKINSSNLGLTARFEADLGRLFIWSDETGEDVQYSFADPDGFLSNALQLTSQDGTRLGEGQGQSLTFKGVNAEFIYNGAQISRSTNEFTAGGVSFTLLEADPGKTITVTVSQDTDAIIERVEGFVNKYNEIVEYLNGKLVEKRYFDFPPLTPAQREEMSEKEIELWEEKAKSGLLRGDSLLSRILADMRLALTSPVSGADSNYSSLADIGIRTGSWQERGILHLDKDALRRALEEDAAGVAALFRQDGSDDASSGVIRRLEKALDIGMEHITNRVGRAGAPVDESTIGRQIGWINDAIERAEARLSQREAYFYRQFSILESFMSAMNTQSLWLYQAFGGGM